jgi:hypothetical protein
MRGSERHANVVTVGDHPDRFADGRGFTDGRGDELTGGR